MKKCNKLSPMKIIEEAVKRMDGASALQRALVREGVNISQSALSQAKNHSKQSLRLDVIVAIVKVAFKGDWRVAGRLLEEEFGN